MQEAIVNQISELVKQEISNFSDLGKVEQAIFSKLQSIGNDVLQNLLNEGDKGYLGSSLYCQTCGGSMRFIAHRPRQFHSIFG